MSKWSHVSGSIKCKNPEGVKKLLATQKFTSEPWRHYTNPYSSLKGSEGDVGFKGEGDELHLHGDLRDVGTIPEDRNQLLKDFQEIIKLVDGQGYIELEYEYEGTIVVDFYNGKFDTRIFPKADGWDKYFDFKEGLK